MSATVTSIVVLFDGADPAQRDAPRRSPGCQHARDLDGRHMHRRARHRRHKLDVLAQEHGEAVDPMRMIKRALDPRDIMNPGKTVPL
jgi:FAD/FMN-containing dehydrogenase